MVNQDLVNRIISLMDQGFIKVADIKNVDYSAAVVSYYKSEVVNGKITADQYLIITDQTYVA